MAEPSQGSRFWGIRQRLYQNRKRLSGNDQLLGLVASRSNHNVISGVFSQPILSQILVRERNPANNARFVALRDAFASCQAQAATPQHEAISVSFLLFLFLLPLFFAAADAVCAVPRIVSVCSRLLLLDFECRVLNIPDKLTFCACKSPPEKKKEKEKKKLPTTRFPGTARRGSKAVCVYMLCAVRY
jgi:hypothetical protein